MESHPEQAGMTGKTKVSRNRGPAMRRQGEFTDNGAVRSTAAGGFPLKPDFSQGRLIGSGESRGAAPPNDAFV
ncbi:hypothetical protein AJ78_04075 [Emergomyces pasteurianus Ep9510]|uniref:Uncharacterized protein n=1 Tax=Emergomyces pasteurianus Ep9510 TaxID=1447872 RepID=A0A1J9PIG8_9EURO|nr:hypothetical protein AJ78_04075 [Emergomyces pasteurianus Ep9510]